MAVGLRAAGFRPEYLYETDEPAWETLKLNGLVPSAPPSWEEHKGDVSLVDWSEIDRPVRLLAGGVPCQPFSLAGKHLADRDGRNLFPELFRAMVMLRPRAILLENVKGLLRSSFRPYFEYILRRLECPSLEPKKKELWQDHDRRLRAHQESRGYQPEYNIVWQLLEAADYGVPQKRSRVFLVATDNNDETYDFPEPTHSSGALSLVQESGEYWDRHEIVTPEELPLRLPKGWQPDDREPWVTVRDTMVTLPEPARAEDLSEDHHWMIPGARSYPGHTGSHPDLPSKTVKAGVHGEPGGENTLQLNGNGDVRYYTLREAAEMQTFPRDYMFSGARRRITRQIGNAVPCLLSEVVGTPLFQLLDHENAGAE
jgi:DNA (cytosine-5)-methyltransferase 1